MMSLSPAGRTLVVIQTTPSPFAWVASAPFIMIFTTTCWIWEVHPNVPEL
jgi:hypothetical protein